MKELNEVYGKEAFDISEHILNVKIPYNKLAMYSENVPHDVLHDVPCDDTSVIIEMIRNNPKVTRIEMATSIGKTVKTVQRIINKCNKITYVGSGDKGHWEIKE